MRLAALILGLFAGIGTFVHTFLRYVLDQLGHIDAGNCYYFKYDLESSMELGWAMSVIGLIAAGLVIQYPRATFFLFLLAAFPGLVIHGGPDRTYYCVLPD